MTDLESRVTHGYAENDGVKIHYASLGTGPLMVLIHGFPEFWYSWRHQIEPLAAEGYQVVAIDMRGYNLSDKPQGAEHYDMRLLVGDIVAVVRHFGQERAIIVGHDWGGAVAWQVAMHLPALTEKLIILNVPHPHGLMRELARNPEQQRNSQYARDFQQDGAAQRLTTNLLTGWITDPEAKARYVEALGRSDFAAMLAYYQRNFPHEPYTEDPSPIVKVQAPVLILHGLQDPFLLPGALNETWQWLDNDLTLVTIPHAGHFVQQDAPDLVTRTMRMWLAR